MTVGVERQTGRMVLIDGQAGVSAGGSASVMPGASGIGGSDRADGQVYGLIVSGRGLVPYVDSAFRVEAGMVPVELVVSSGPYSAGKATDDDCAFCDLFGTFNDQQEEEADDETPEEEAETDSTSSEGGPDLIVQSPSVSAAVLTPGQAFTLNATVHNQGDQQAAATMLHYYRSNNATITASDTEVGTGAVDSLDASATSAQSIELTVPTGGGSGVYYGACVASVRGETNTDNNCSSAVKITVSGQEATKEEGDETSEEEGGGTGGGQGDLIIQSVEVSDNSLTAGQPFTLEVTLNNPGVDTASGWLYFFRSTDATMDITDVLIHEYSDSAARSGATRLDLELGASATQTVSLDWEAPSYAGTYYYGACLDRWWTFNNCSTGVRATVEGNAGGTPDLAVSSMSVSHEKVTPGSGITLFGEVENIGTGPAAATEMTWYRSDDGTIDATDDATNHLTPRRGSATTGGLFVTTRTQGRFTKHIAAPLKEGTYYYGLCVVPTIGEINLDNNCSSGVRLIVEEAGSPDLVVVRPTILDHRPAMGEFRLWTVVLNIGSGTSTEWTEIRYYRSDDATIDATDTEIRNLPISPLGPEQIGRSQWYDPDPDAVVDAETAPTNPGTYYYGACVVAVPGESDANNNCSEAVPMNVGVPDLAVGLAWVSTSVPLAGQSLTLTATVRNQGPEQAGSTTLRYYRSDDATIDANDTPIGTDALSSLTGFDGLVSGPGSRLAASGTSRESISVSAPSTPGTYYYGACVDGVSGEANTDNNCSTGAYVRVVPTGQDPFNIELVFVNDFTDAREDVMQQAARRWETIITEGLPAVDFSANPHSFRFGDETIVVDDTVDDLRIFVSKDATVPLGLGGPSYVRAGNPACLPAIGQVWIGAPGLERFQVEEPLWQEERLLRNVMVHEIAHVLGFGTLWESLGLRHELTGDTYFSGALAIQAFNAAGGEDYSGNKVPLGYSSRGTGCSVADHWRSEVFQGPAREFGGAEVMEPSMQRENRLSAITLQSIADLGYVVDVSRADPYRLPASVNTAQPGTASGKPVASLDSDLGAGALGPIYVGDEQGRISHTISSD